jgi:hypothetical protein
MAGGARKPTLYRRGVDLNFILDQLRTSRATGVSNCAGITGWLRVTNLARTAGSGVQPLHSGTPCQLGHGPIQGGWVEAHSFDIDHYTTRPLKLADGLAIALDEPAWVSPSIGKNFEQKCTA